jgi:PAS domain S-box-containing protein
MQEQEHRTESSLYVTFREMAARYERLVMEQSMLREIDELKALTEDTDGLCRTLVRAVASGLSAENCSIMLVDESGEYLELRAGASPLDGLGGTYVARKGTRARLRLGEGVAGKVAQLRYPAAVADVRHEPTFAEMAGGTVEIRSLLCLPLVAENQLLGVLNLSHPQPDFFNTDIRRAVDLAAERIARVLMTHQLHRLLRESETRYRLVAENAADGVLVFNLDGRVASANPGIRRIIGTGETGLVTGKILWESGIHPDDLAAFESFQQASYASDQPLTLSYRYRDASGDQHALEHINAPLKSASGKVLGLVAAIRDVTALRAADESLRSSEEKFRTLAESTSAATFIYQGKEIKYVNPAAVAITGYTREELLKMPFWAFIHPEFREEVRRRGEARMRGEKVPRQYELKIITKDGRERWVDFSAGTFTYEGQIAILGIVFDVTERKQTEDALRQFKFIVDNAGEEFYLINPDGSLEYVNDAVVKSLGYSREEVLALGIPGIDPEHDHERFVQHFQEVKKGSYPPFETIHVAKDGRWIIKEVQSVYLKIGEREYIYGVARDVTERKRAEETLRQSEERFRSLAELMPALIAEVDLKGVVIYVNQHGLHMTGYSWEDFWAGFHSTDLIVPEQRARARQNFLRVIEGEDLGAQEYYARTKNGEIMCLLCRSAPIVRNGHIEGARSIFFDITARKQIEERLRKDEARSKALLELSNIRSFSRGEIEAQAIETAVQLTDSVFGYFAFVSADESVLTMQQWSRVALEQCAIQDRQYVYVVKDTGLWGEAVRQRRAVITNDYSAQSPDKKGIPAGHVPLVRHMNVPVFDGGRIVAVAGVGNKETDYTEEDARELTLFMDGVWRVVCQKRAEEALERRDTILEAVAYAAASFLKTVSWEEDIHDVLMHLGKATAVSRVYVFETKIDQEGEHRAHQRYEWAAEGTPTHLGDPFFQEYKYQEAGFGRWGTLLREGHAVYGLARDFPDAEASILDSRGILAVAVVPLFVGGQVWGVLGFNDCTVAREWSHAEVGALRAAAATLGAAIERQRAERIIAEQRLKMVASSRLSSLGVMAGGVAHEINNPLAVISIGAEQLLRLCASPAPDTRQIVETADKMCRNVGRIERIVRGLRILSRDGSEERFQMKRIGEVVEETLELCRSRFESHGIEFIVDNQAPAMEIECRPTLLFQVIMNLLNNAFDAVEEAPQKWVRIGIEDRQDTVELSITDSGPGVPENLREKIMEPFYTTKDVGRGTGLGLSICKAVAESHRGDLFLDVTGANTRFVVRLPLRQKQENK